MAGVNFELELCDNQGDAQRRVTILNSPVTSREDYHCEGGHVSLRIMQAILADIGKDIRGGKAGCFRWQLSGTQQHSG